MSWSKLKQDLESFLCPTLYGRVEYRAISYRYLPDKAGLCYITVDKKNVLNMSDITTLNTLDFIVSIRHILFNGMSETIGYLDYLE